MATTPAANPLSTAAGQALYLQFQQQWALYNTAAAKGDTATAKLYADRANCIGKELGFVATLPYVGYQPPTNCSAVLASLPVPPATTTPGSLMPPAPAPAPATSTPPATPQSLTTAKPALVVGGGGGCDPEEPSYCCYYPDDPLCFGGGGGGGGGSTTIINNYYTVGVDDAEVNSLIDSALGNLWRIIVDVFDAAIAFALAQLQAAITAIGNALKAVFSALARLAGLILKALQAIWHGVVQGLLAALKKLAKLFEDFINKVLLPVMDAIRKIRDKLLKIYERFIRPVLIWLQRLRQFLAILKLFHIKWAIKLDATLADIQRRISGPLFYLLSYINAVANWINLIMTAGYLIRRSIFLNSLNAYKGSSLNLLYGAQIHPVSAGELTALQQAHSVPSAQQTINDFDIYANAGGGSMQPLVGAAADQWQRQTSQAV